MSQIFRGGPFLASVFGVAGGSVTPPDPPVVAKTIQPSASWSGSPLSSGTPVQADTVYGSGFAERVVCAFDEPPNMWVEQDDYEITVGAAIGNRAWVEKCTFWLEGTEVVVDQMTINNRTGSIGYSIIPQSRPGQNGDAVLYATVKPVNGQERVISIPLTLNTDRTAGVVITRPVRYINSDTGNDATGNGLTPETAWATIGKALPLVGSGGIINMAGAAPFDWQSNAGNVNTRMTELRGAGRAFTTIKQVTPGLMRWSTTLLLFDSLTVLTDNVTQMYANSAPTGRIVFRNAVAKHSGGPAGNISKGYPEGYLPSEKTGQFYRDQDGQRWYALESTISDINTTYFNIARNSDITTAGDIYQVGAYPNTTGNIGIFNLRGKQYGNAEIRRHTPVNLVVASAVKSGSNTVITFSGSPGIGGFPVGDGNIYMRVVESTTVPAGDREFPINPDGTSDFDTLGYAIVSGSPTATTLTVIGDLTGLAPGDLCRAYSINHGDAMQFMPPTDGSPNTENYYFQRYKATAHSWQIILTHAGWLSSNSGGATGTPSKIIASWATVSTVGNTATFSAAHGLHQYDWVVLGNGSQVGQTRLVEEIISPTVVRLSSGFSVDQSGATWGGKRTHKDIAFVDCILHKSGNNAELGQIEPGQIHMSFINCTLPGINGNGGTLLFNHLDAAEGSLRSIGFFDSVVGNLNVAAPSVFPTIVGDNNHYETGMARDTVGEATTGYVFGGTAGGPYAQGYLPNPAVVGTVKSVMSPYDINGKRRVVGSPVGAVAK